MLKKLWVFLQNWRYEGLESALREWAWYRVHDDDDHYIEWNEEMSTALLQVVAGYMLTDLREITQIIATRAEDIPF